MVIGCPQGLKAFRAWGDGGLTVLGFWAQGLGDRTNLGTPKAHKHKHLIGITSLPYWASL